MKALSYLFFTASMLVLSGCSSVPTYTQKDSPDANMIKITNYDRIHVNSSDIEINVKVSESESKGVADKQIITEMLEKKMKEKGFNVTFTANADYIVLVHGIYRTDHTPKTFSALPSNFANTAHQATGSSSAGAAALGVGMLANALSDKRMWMIDFSILDKGEEHTRLNMLAPAAAGKPNLNWGVSYATSEYFVQAK